MTLEQDMIGSGDRFHTRRAGSVGGRIVALLGVAVLAGITEMYVPALLVKEAAAPARFFICILSISQLIFFSSVAPMMLDLFRDLPIRVRDLLGIFVLRTVVLVPLLAAWTAVLDALGVFAGR